MSLAGPSAGGPGPVPLRLVPVNGRRPWPAVLPEGVALLASRLDLDQLLHGSARATSPVLVDLDEVDGLAPDQRAVAFLLGRLGVAGLVTRHVVAARAGAESGTLTFLRLSVLDSTGLERGLSIHPRIPGLGTAVSPGLVLPYLSPVQMRSLPRPVLAYGLVRTDAEAAACRRAGAESVLQALTP